MNNRMGVNRNQFIVDPQLSKFLRMGNRYIFFKINQQIY